MLNLLRDGWILDFVFIPAEWQVQTQSGQRFFNSCGMLVKCFKPETITSRGKKVPVIYDGVNLLPYLQGKMQDARPHQQLFWRLMPSGSAMRDGDWKLIFTTHHNSTIW